MLENIFGDFVVLKFVELSEGSLGYLLIGDGWTVTDLETWVTQKRPAMVNMPSEELCCLQDMQWSTQ